MEHEITFGKLTYVSEQNKLNHEMLFCSKTTLVTLVQLVTVKQREEKAKVASSLRAA